MVRQTCPNKISLRAFALFSYLHFFLMCDIPFFHLYKKISLLGSASNNLEAEPNIRANYLKILLVLCFEYNPSKYDFTDKFALAWNAVKGYAVLAVSEAKSQVSVKYV